MPDTMEKNRAYLGDCLIEKDENYFGTIEKRLQNTRERLFLYNKYDGIEDKKQLEKAKKLEEDKGRLF